MNSNPTLYVVATPIGNLEDMVPRGREVLQSVAVIAAEDTRHSARLLSHFGISTKLVSYHDHSRESQVQRLLGILERGDSVALISDAGTPLISDPGYQLVHQVRRAGFPVVPIPGACAFVAALSASGLPSDRFWFEGFLAAKTTGRRKRLEELADTQGTLIFYESRHRIVAMLEDLHQVYPGRRVVLARELTKQFETFLEGCAAELLEVLRGDENQQKGEFVVLMEGAAKGQDKTALDSDQVLRVLLEELPVKKAAAVAARLTGGKKNALYQRALALKS